MIHTKDGCNTGDVSGFGGVGGGDLGGGGGDLGGGGGGPAIKPSKEWESTVRG